MAKRFLLVETVLILCLPLVEACAKQGQPYLPRPNPHLYGNPRVYKKALIEATVRHEEAMQKSEKETSVT